MDLRNLEELVSNLIEASAAYSTRRVYVSGQRQYQSFCQEANVTILPLSEHKACLFVAHCLVSSGLKPSTIKVYLSAVRRLQVEAGLGDSLYCVMAGSGVGGEGS